MAKLKKHEFLTLEHLMLELCKDKEVKSLFSFYKIDEKKIIQDLEQFIENKLKDIIVSDEVRPTPSACFERVLKRAAQHVKSSGKREVRALNILGKKKDFDRIVNIKVRSTGRLLKSNINFANNSAKVTILDKETGISPGQACVFYSKDETGDKVLGGGWIDKTINNKLST